MPEPRKTREPGSRRRRTIRRALAGVVALVLLLGAATGLFAWKVVNHPTMDPLPDPGKPVDVLMVLGPLDDWRMPTAEDWMRRGVARNLVLSTPTLPRDARYCDVPHAWPAFCFMPSPPTTRGEAEGLGRLMSQHGWHSVLVLTADFHVDRARFIFERCLRQTVAVRGPGIGVASSEMVYQLAYQTVGFAKEILLGPC